MKIAACRQVVTLIDDAMAAIDRAPAEHVRYRTLQEASALGPVGSRVPLRAVRATLDTFVGEEKSLINREFRDVLAKIR